MGLVRSRLRNAVMTMSENKEILETRIKLLKQDSRQISYAIKRLENRRKKMQAKVVALKAISHGNYS